MSDMKFSCPQCGQNIGCDEAWAGHQLECPACHNSIVVPQLQRPPAASPVSVPVREPAKPAGAKLATGVTQVPRSTAHAPAPVRKFIPKRHVGDNSLLKYGGMALVVAALAWAGYFYGLPLINGALQQETTTNPSSSAKPSQSAGGGGSIGGPMGDVGGAMDASEALDAGSSSTKARPTSSTNNATRPRPAKSTH